MMTSKSFLYNFSAQNIYETFFHNICVEKAACFYFCPHFYKAFVGGFIHHQSVIYEQGKYIYCYCLECLKSFSVILVFFRAKKRLFH